jgi:hypothetical protein
MAEVANVDPLNWVRSQPTRFFNREQPDAVHLLAYIMADTVGLSRGECVIRTVGDWCVIGSNNDWLAHEKYSELELFRHVVPAPEYGEHSMRGEILVSAFAKDVSVINEGDELVIQGQAPPSLVVDAASGMKQAVAFRLERRV